MPQPLGIRETLMSRRITLIALIALIALGKLFIQPVFSQASKSVISNITTKETSSIQKDIEVLRTEMTSTLEEMRKIASDVKWHSSFVEKYFNFGLGVIAVLPIFRDFPNTARIMSARSSSQDNTGQVNHVNKPAREQGRGLERARAEQGKVDEAGGPQC